MLNHCPHPFQWAYFCPSLLRCNATKNQSVLNYFFLAAMVLFGVQTGLWLDQYQCWSRSQIGPIPIRVQVEKIWSWIRIIFEWMILLRMFVFRDHLKGFFWSSKQPISVYEVSGGNFDNVHLYHVHNGVSHLVQRHNLFFTFLTFFPHR